MPIPIEALRAVRRVIVHAHCPDGRASALILHAALPTAEICEMSYGSPEHEALEPEPGMLFCDFTPPKDRLQAFADAGAIVLDHHEARLVAPFGERGVFGENAKAESGAELAFREVAVPMLDLGGRLGGPRQAHRGCLEALARLAAIRDTWQRDSPAWDEACELSEALRFVPLEDALAMGAVRFSFLAADVGPILWRQAREEAARVAATAVRYTTPTGVRAAIVATRKTSDVIDLLADEVDVLVGFEYVHEAGRVKLVISMRSRGGLDVRRVALNFRGGGHPPAAGFQLPVTLSPYAHEVRVRSAYAEIFDVLNNAELFPGKGADRAG